MSNGMKIFIIVLIVLLIISIIIVYMYPSCWDTLDNVVSVNRFSAYGELYRLNSIDNDLSFLLSLSDSFDSLPEDIFTNHKSNHMKLIDSSAGFKIERSGMYTVRLNMSVSSLDENMNIDAAIFHNNLIQMNTVTSTTLTKEINTVTSFGKISCKAGDIVEIRVRSKTCLSTSQMIIRYINFMID